MDLTFWTIAGGIAVVGLILLRAALLWGKQSPSPRSSPRLRRVQELRRRVDEKAATRDAAAKKAASDQGAAEQSPPERPPERPAERPSGQSDDS